MQILQASCGPLVPGVIDPPENAVMYLSVRGPGKIVYKCVEKNNPIVLSENGKMAADPEISKGWTATIETKDNIRVLTTSNSNVKPTAENVFILGDRPVSQRVLDAAPDLRWEVVSNTGASAAEGGIPAGGNYVTRTNAEGGAPPRVCDAGETVEVDFEASYNIYSCDSAYLTAAPTGAPADAPKQAVPPEVQSPPPVDPTAVPPTASVAPQESPSPITAPPVISTPPTVSPVAVSPPPEPVTPVIVAAAPAPAPESGASATMIGGGILALVLAAL